MLYTTVEIKVPEEIMPYIVYDSVDHSFKGAAVRDA